MANVIRLHHVAFAHQAGDDVHALLAELFGLKTVHTEPGDGFVERMIPLGDSYLQTLEACGAGIVERFVEQRGASLHHVAFEVDDVEAMVERLREAGVSLVDERPRPGGMGSSIAFIHPAVFGGMLVELVQPVGAGDGSEPL